MPSWRPLKRLLAKLQAASAFEASKNGLYGARADGQLNCMTAMTIPTLLPDELAFGYLCRMARMYALKNMEQTYAFLRAALPAREGKVPPGWMVDVLSELLGVSPDMIITQHTMVPFLKAVRGAKSCAQHSESQDRSCRSALTYPYRTKRDLQFCPACILEDVDFHGVSFWRRSHQLRGVVFCSKHGCALHSVVAHRLGDLPADMLEISAAISDDIVEDALRNPVIRRYEEICSMFALRPRPLPMESVNRRMRCRAEGVCTTGPKGSLRLTPLAIEKVGGPWLSSFFPGLEEKQQTGRAGSIDCVVGTPTVPLATQYYALALALLFDHADEAMYCMTQAELDASNLIDPTGRLDRASENVDQLYLKMGDAKASAISALLAGSSIREAAKIAGVRGPDLEAMVIACAVERLSQLSQNAH